MSELERALVALGSELEFPPTPDLVGPVRARLARRPRWRMLAAAVALLAVAFGIAMAVPQARSAILRFFHIGAVTVERVETLPHAARRPLVAGLGAPLSRPAAELRARLAIKLPRLAGPAPTRYYAQPGLIATLLRYRGKPVLLAEMGNDQVFLTKKILSPGTEVEDVDLGRHGLWLHGGKHVLMWSFGLGEVRQIDTRLAGNVLIWLAGKTTYRLEGDLDQGQMLQLAHQITR
jgi:hypothetical protein